MGARDATRKLLRADMLPLLPATVLVAVVIAWIATGGGYESQPALDVGYEPDPWYLGGLTLIALLCATAFGMGRVRMSRASKVACAALFAYVVWSFASVLWAHDQGAAFLGSDRALVYFAAFLTFAILPWRDIPARLAMGALICGIGAIAILTAAKVATASAPGPLYLGARLAYPLGYYNADAVMFMGAAAGAIALAAQRTTPAVLRVVGLSLAALCLQLAVLSQSRGWLFSAPVVLALMLLLIPGRLRLLLFALAAGAATAIVAPALLDVYGKATPGGETLAQPRLNAVLYAQGNHAVKAMLVVDIVLAALATAAVIVDRRLSLSPQAQRRLDRTSRVAAVAIVLAGAAAALVAVHGDVIGRIERAWKSFAHTPTPTGGGSSHFTTLASNRSDIWRVALHEFAHNPLGGLGQDNFAASYIRLRHTYEQPRWTHSIELRLLTHTGLIGGLLFAAFLLAAAMAALRGRRGVERTTAGILLVFLVVWLVQGSIDWFWEYPALSVPALAFTAAAGALGRVAPLPAPSLHRRLSIAAALAAILLGVGALLALGIPFLAARRAREATAVWQTQPTRAFEVVRSASNLMPFDPQLYLLGASIALNLGEYPRARAWLEEAESHDNQNWLTPFALGLVEGEEGRLAAAKTQLSQAELLNPLEPAVGTALSRATEGHPLSFAAAQALLAPHIATPRS
jgi:hypothetical protein